MKALSLYEPWASAVWTGAKTWETRSWWTGYRGPLLICAAKMGAKSRDLRNLLELTVWQGALAPLKGRPLWSSDGPAIHPEDLQFGKALCIVNLTHCISSNVVTGNIDLDTERVLGDFSPDRWLWKLDDLYRLPKPLPVKGNRRIFEVDLIEVTAKNETERAFIIGEHGSPTT